MSKICVHCSSPFSQRQNEPAYRFEVRQFCRRECSAAYTSRRRSAAHEADCLSTFRIADDGCWNWTGNVFSNGYGRIKLGYKSLRAHRVAYERANGTIPARMVVRHTCDNPLCINPSHLLLGTHADNKRDAVTRRRHAYGKAVGTAKLTDAQALAIRRSDKPSAELAEQFGISTALVNRIKRGAAWKHLQFLTEERAA